MRIDLHRPGGRAVARVDADPSSPPPVVHTRKTDGSIEEHFLDWDGAFDDERHLRKCPACGCTDLYVRRLFPARSGFIALLVVAATYLALFGTARAQVDTLIGLIAAVVVVNLLLTGFSPKFLACYRCDSGYHGVPISRDRGPWDGSVADRYAGSRAGT